MSFVQGRTPEAIPYYRRAVEANPDLPEAVCGLANALSAVCDWRGRGGEASDLVIDYDGNIRTSASTLTVSDGWMPKLLQIVRKQLSAAYSFNVGIVQSIGTCEDWLDWIERTVGGELSPIQRKRWEATLQLSYTSIDRRQENINEGGFVVRVVEWLMRVLQRRWYIEVYGQNAYSANYVSPIHGKISPKDRAIFRRPQLPASVASPTLPSVLPFHTVRVLIS